MQNCFNYEDVYKVVWHIVDKFGSFFSTQNLSMLSIPLDRMELHLNFTGAYDNDKKNNLRHTFGTP